MDEIPHVWRWPPNKDVDPNDQADAAIKLINAGLKTRQAYLVEQDIDPETHNQQLAAEGWHDPLSHDGLSLPTNQPATTTSETPAGATYAEPV